MRQGQQQQNRRNRGRTRKPQNPLTRTYESNGPDVKIRGTASHIAERYITLARDAASSGDTVTSENFYQHAEHYNRIIATAQAQSQAEQQVRGRRPNGEDVADAPHDEATDGEAVPAVAQPNAEQPRIDAAGDAGDDPEAQPRPRRRKTRQPANGREGGGRAPRQRREEKSAHADDSSNSAGDSDTSAPADTAPSDQPSLDLPASVTGEPVVRNEEISAAS